MGKVFRLLLIFMIIVGSITLITLIIFAPKPKGSEELLRGQKEILCIEYYYDALGFPYKGDKYIINNFRIDSGNVAPNKGDKHFPVSDCEPVKRIDDEIRNNK